MSGKEKVKHGINQKIKKKINQRGFAARQFILLFEIGAVILSTVLIVNYQRQRSTLQREFYEDMRERMKVANSLVDTQIRVVENIVRLTRIDSQSEEGVNKFEQYLTQIVGESSDIYNIFVQMDDGEMYSNNHLLYQLRGNPDVDTCMEAAHKEESMIIWSEPYYSSMTANTTVAVALHDSAWKQTIAVEFNFNPIYMNLSAALRNKGMSFILFSREGKELIFDRNQTSLLEMVTGQYPLHLVSYYARIGRQTQYQPYQEEIMNGDNGLCYMQSLRNKIGWKLLVIYNTSELNSNSHGMLQNLLILFIIGVFSILIAVLLVVTYFTKPIRRLGKKMANVNNLDNLIPIEYEKDDEIGKLTQSYNLLVKRIHILVNNVKAAEQAKAQYEFRMHQSQIGPHFLHNALYCISSLIRQGRLDEANHAMIALSDLLSYSFDTVNNEVTLANENDSLKRFMDIMKMRYGNIFHYDNQIKEQFLNCSVLKLTLQPLVENSISHGLASVEEGEGRIVLRAYRHGSTLSILVADNGIGMKPETIRQIFSGTFETYKKDRFSNIGIINVHDRIRLVYGEGYGLKIRSVFGQGTIVRICIPFRVFEQ